MGGDAFAELKDFDGGGGEASLQLLTGELIGNAVVMPVDLDVVIDVGADGFPIGHHIAFGRQRLKSGPIHFDEQRSASAVAFAKSTMIQLFEQFVDGLVQFRQREEPLDAAAPPVSSAPR